MSPDGRFRRALVTGGAGFIGHHLARALLARGIEVTVLDDLSMGRRENLPPEARFVQGDVRDPEGRHRRAGRRGLRLPRGRDRLDPRLGRGLRARRPEVNLVGTLNVLQCMADSGVKKAVFASSMAVYADSPAPTPLPEDSPLRPISPYGIASSPPSSTGC